MNGNDEYNVNKTIFNCWSDAIKRFFDIQGRTTRYEFWAFQTVSLLIFIIAAVIGFVFGYYKIIFEIYTLYFLVPATTVSIRRFHDIGMTGLWVTPAFIFGATMLICWELSLSFTLLPLFLLLCYMSYMYWLLSQNGENTDNTYGSKIDEPAICNQDSKVFITFMTVFLCILWIIFLYQTLF